MRLISRQFLYNLLRNASRLIDIEFEYIVIFIGTEDSIFENLRPFFKGRLDIIQGLPESFDPFIDKSKAGLFIIEDLMRQSAEDIRVGDIFTKRGHHENLSICLVLQNLFSRGKERITCFRSSHYIVVFRNPLDSTVIFSLAQKLEPSKRKRATEMLNNIVTKYRYVLLDGKTARNAKNSERHIFTKIYENSKDMVPTFYIC